ncbi:ATP-binding protein [Argonema galeatum]|uniref:ATP-binding protein n=1 Tax=Argonema galeatum TaxID=2942762 RepID=UPI002013B860|nr:ATP-binding protein [Argonema galeatum]MCL1468895.1 ATP-binding protein [Argonema galeatum A003/A1]
MTQKKLKHALGLRYSGAVGKLAEGIAKDMHSALDAEVIRQLAGMAEKDAAISATGARLGDCLRRWRWLSEIAGTFFLFNTAIAVGASISPGMPAKGRILLCVDALGSALLCKFTFKSSREKKAIASVLARMEAAECGMQLSRIAKAPVLLQPVQPALPPSNFSEPSPSATVKNFDTSEVIEESTGIGLLGNSGSGKTCLAKLLASEMGGQILVLDPHDDPENTNWSGLHVIRDYPVIAEQLELLLGLLDNRDKTALCIIADEWPGVRAWCKQQGTDVADRFLLRYGSEARKFNKLPIFCSQSGNVKALGLEGMGDFLENFSLIRLHRVAEKHARNLSDRSVFAWCNQVAYPCLVGDEPHVHPTHGHHERFYKGAPPRGLKPLRSSQLTIPLAK